MTEIPACVTTIVFLAAFLIPLVVSTCLGKETQKANEQQEQEPPPLAEGTMFAGLSKKERLDLLLSEWKTVTEMQMHFNDMIIRMRTLAVSVVISVFGAAGFAIAQFEDNFVQIFGEDIHIAALVIAFGELLWLTIFVIDYGYYYKLLVGAVRRGWQIDDAFRNERLLDGVRLFGGARLISHAIGPEGYSRYFVWAFYGLVYLAGLSYLVAVLIILDPPLGGAMT